MVNPVVATHLKEARRELVTQREQLDRDIAQIDSMLQGYAGAAPRQIDLTVNESRGLTDDVRLAVEPAPPMRDAIQAHLASEDRGFTTNEVAVALHDKYGWQKSSTRSLISKMGKAGEVHSVRRGVYETNDRFARRTLDQISLEDASTPVDVTGVEDQVTTTDTGGEPHVQADQGHDHHLSRREDRDDQRGASVGGSISG